MGCMVRVQVRAYGRWRSHLPDPDGSGREELLIPSGTTLEGLQERLGIPQTTWVLVAVNDQVSSRDQPLCDDDIVTFFEPIHGG